MITRLLRALMIPAALLTGASALAYPASAVAQDSEPLPSWEELTPDEQTAVEEFIYGNAIQTLFHEAGHMLVTLYSLPMVAREEDAADNLASVIMLVAESEIYDLAMSDTIYGYFLSEEESVGDDPYPEDVFWDEHSLDRQRAYQMLCLMVGNDPEGFSQLADDFELPAERRERCEYEWAQISQSWIQQLEPHFRQTGESPIEVIYEEPTRDSHWLVYEMARNRAVLEEVAHYMSTNFAFDQKVTIRAKTCEMINAFWDPQALEITYCYDFSSYYGYLMVKDLVAQREENGG